jgi:hypothetical protein
MVPAQTRELRRVSRVQILSDAHHTHHRSRFLWARLQIDVLWETCTTDDEINFALSNLPKGLNETYGRCLERVANKDQQYSLRVLRYVYEAKTPLTTDPLGEALATDPDTGELQHGRIPVHTAILSSGANLVVFDEVENFIIPAHHSVRKFVENSKADILRDLKLSIWYDAEMNLGEMCIAHLLWHTSDHTADNVRPETMPGTTQLRLPSMEKLSQLPVKMLPPLISSWLPKWRESATTSSRSKQGPMILTVPKPRNKTLRLYGPFHSYARSNWISLTATASATSLQLERLVRLDLANSENEHWHGDSQIFPWRSDSLEPLSSKILGWAICNGHLPLLEIGITLQKDLKMPLVDYEGLWPLHLAARHGRIDVFLELRRRVKPNTCTEDKWQDVALAPGTGRAALHYAAEKGRAEIVNVLLRFDKVSNLKAVRMYDDKMQNPLYLAVSSGSLPTLREMESKCGPLIWEVSDDIDALLWAFTEGGLLPEVVGYVLRKINVRPPMYHEEILTWVIHHDDITLIPSLTKAGISLDTAMVIHELTSVRAPAIFFALEKPTSAMASALIENRAKTDVAHYLTRPERQGRGYLWGKIYPIDLILSRGWTHLASSICPSIEGYKWYNERQLSLQVTHSGVDWLSILMVDWIVNWVVCKSHTSCSFVNRLDSHQRYVFARNRDNDELHQLRISMVSPEPTESVLKFKLMMGTKETEVFDWRTGPRTTVLDRHYGLGMGAIRIETARFAHDLNLNANPYNIQLVCISSDGIQCSSNMTSWDKSFVPSTGYDPRNQSCTS